MSHSSARVALGSHRDKDRARLAGFPSSFSSSSWAASHQGWALGMHRRADGESPSPQGSSAGCPAAPPPSCRFPVRFHGSAVTHGEETAPPHLPPTGTRGTIPREHPGTHSSGTASTGGTGQTGRMKPHPKPLNKGVERMEVTGAGDQGGSSLGRWQGQGGSGFIHNSLTQLGPGWAQEQTQQTIGSGHGRAHGTRMSTGYGS